MGMYDNLGNYQVKVFGVPLTPLSQDSENPEKMVFSPYESGGKLRYFKENARVPYKNLIYNYGKNFIVIDYRCFLMKNEFEIIHIIENGRYKKSINYRELPECYRINLVLDNYGKILNIHHKRDFADIIREHKEAFKKYNRLKKEYCEAFNTEENLSIFKYKQMSPEAQKEYIKNHSIAMDKAFNESLKLFSDKWLVSPDSDIYKKINDTTALGFVIAECINQKAIEWEKYITVQAYSEQIAKKNLTINEMIKRYCSWNHDVKETEVREIISKYSAQIPECVEKEYKESITYKIRNKK